MKIEWWKYRRSKVHMLWLLLLYHEERWAWFILKIAFLGYGHELIAHLPMAILHASPASPSVDGAGESVCISFGILAKWYEYHCFWYGYHF